jgi:hypothetical protein
LRHSFLFYFYFLDALEVLAKTVFFSAEENLKWLDGKIVLDADWQILSVLCIELISLLPFAANHLFHQHAHLFDGNVVSLSSLEVLNCFLVSFGELAWNPENERILF